MACLEHGYANRYNENDDISTIQELEYVSVAIMCREGCNQVKEALGAIENDWRLSKEEVKALVEASSYFC